jgi:hypothetical protein
MTMRDMLGSVYDTAVAAVLLAQQKPKRVDHPWSMIDWYVAEGEANSARGKPAYITSYAY